MCRPSYPITIRVFCYVFPSINRIKFFRKRFVKPSSSFRKPKDHNGSYSQAANKPHTLFLEDPFNTFFYLRPSFLSVFNSSVFSTKLLYACRSSSVRFVILGHRSCSCVSLSEGAAVQLILFYTLLCSYSLSCPCNLSFCSKIVKNSVLFNRVILENNVEVARKCTPSFATLLRGIPSLQGSSSSPCSWAGHWQ